MDMDNSLRLVILLVLLAVVAISIFFAYAPHVGAALLLVAAAVALSGCAVGERVVDQLPTARYCSEVHYDRVQQDVTLSAKCTAPFGGM